MEPITILFYSTLLEALIFTFLIILLKKSKKSKLSKSKQSLEIKQTAEIIKPKKPKKPFLKSLLKKLKSSLKSLILLLNPKTLFQKLKRKLKTNPPKLENYIIFSIYLLVGIVAFYLLLANVFPNNPINTSGTYELSASDLSLTSNLKSLYITKDVFADKIKINETWTRLLVSDEPFELVFNPKKIIKENTSAKLELDLINKGTDIYLNEKLIIPDLSNYEKIKTFDNKEIWIKSDLKKQTYKDSDTAENFIYENFPQKSIYSFAEISGGVPIIQDYTNSETKIDTGFRDNLKLAVYAEDSLELEFTKKDLNMHIGRDEYTVTITDFNDNLIFEETYWDDGDKKDSNIEDDGQDFKIEIYGLERSIYFIDFAKDDNNKYADSMVGDIKINSNKVLIVGNFLPYGDIDFYTESYASKIIGFNYWSSSNAQKIEMGGIITKTIDLDEDWKSKRYEEELESGEYFFNVDIGYLWIYSDFVSQKRENWFNFPVSADKRFFTSDVIIIDNNKLKINGENFFYSKDVNVSQNTNFKLQALDDYELYLKNMRLAL